MSVARDYDTYNTLKEKLLLKIDEKNAAHALKKFKTKIIERLSKLNVRDITEVEDLYLLVAQLLRAATYLIAMGKADNHNTSIIDEIGSIDTDEMLLYLISIFNRMEEQRDILKFCEIEDRYRPTKEGWAALHVRMNGVAQGVVQENLRTYIRSERVFNNKFIVFANAKEEKLFNQARDIIKQVEAIAGRHPEKPSMGELQSLTEILACTHRAWENRNNLEKTRNNSRELAILAQSASGKASFLWKALGLGLLTFSCTALFLVGILGAIPSGGSGLLFAAIAATGIISGAAGLGIYLNGCEKGLAKSIGFFNSSLFGLSKNKEEKQAEQQENHHPSPG